MTDSLQLQLDLPRLQLIVQSVLQSQTAQVSSWTILPIVQGKASTAGVYRIAGMANEATQTVPWSLILKEAVASAKSAHAGNNASEDITSSWYWKREVLLHRSGLFDMLPEGIRAPHCYRIDEEAGRATIWMEDVREDVGTMWPLAHFAHVCRHFGRLNGHFLAQAPLPTWEWLLRDFIEGLLTKSEWPEFYARYPSLREDALVKRGWDDELVADFQRIWSQRNRLLTALAQLPQTLQHNDSGRKNLVAHRRANGELETVALDWAQCAIGPIGGELAPILAQPVYWFHGIRPEELWELDGIAFSAYVDGLRDAGWHGDPTLPRLGYVASMALRSSFGIFIMEWAARDEGTRHFIEHAIGHAMEEIADVMRELRKYLVTCADEAFRLIDKG